MPFYYRLDETKEADQRTAERLLLLRKKLGEQIPARSLNETLLLATWNIREFDSTKYGHREREALYYIAEIISHFDIVAVQEVNADLKALKDLMRILGSWWDYIITDLTEGTAGNRERGAFIFDSRKVKFGGLAGELVIPPKGKAEPAHQLARTPFVCGFEAGWLRVMVCTVHIYYGKSVANDPKRVEEIRVVSDFLAKRLESKNAWSKNLALVGDFNVFKPEDETFKAIAKNFYVPPQFADKTSNAAMNKHFDQMGFASRAFDKKLVEERLRGFEAGVFDFFDYVYTLNDEAVYAELMGDAYKTKKTGTTRTDRERTNYYKQWRTFQMSDHFPMWIELAIDFGEPYLRSIAAGGERPKFS